MKRFPNINQNEVINLAIYKFLFYNFRFSVRQRTRFLIKAQTEFYANSAEEIRILSSFKKKTFKLSTLRMKLEWFKKMLYWMITKMMSYEMQSCGNTSPDYSSGKCLLRLRRSSQHWGKLLSLSQGRFQGEMKSYEKDTV